MSFDIEKLFLRIAQTTPINENACGVNFWILTLDDELQDELFEENDYLSFLEKAADLGFAIKSKTDDTVTRAKDFAGMTDEKMVKFWQSKEIAELSEEPTFKQMVGLSVARNSGLDEQVEALQAEYEEAMEAQEALDGAIEIDQNALAQDTAAYQQQV